MKKRLWGVLLVLVLTLSLCSCATQEPIEAGELTCTLEVRCDHLLTNLDKMTAEKATLVPADGVIFAEKTLSFTEGESVFDVFRRTLKNEKIHFEYVDAKAYNSVYIEGIANLYEFDCGPRSGWMYSVNGVYPGLGCSDYKLADGDRIVFNYTCTLGDDLGAKYEQ